MKTSLPLALLLSTKMQAKFTLYEHTNPRYIFLAEHKPKNELLYGFQIQHVVYPDKGKPEQRGWGQDVTQPPHVGKAYKTLPELLTALVEVGIDVAEDWEPVEEDA